MQALFREKPGSAVASELAAAPRRISCWAGGVVALALFAALLILIHNRSFPIIEGWFSMYGGLVRQGKVPYRDFYFFCPPLPLFIAQAINCISRKMIFIRYYAATERWLLTAVLYYVLSRRFSAAASCIASLTATVYLLTYPSDDLFGYLYTCLLFVLLATACLQAAYLHPTRRMLFMGLAGCCASLSFFTKQSSGLLETAAVVVAILLLSPSFRQACLDMTCCTVGWVAAAVPFVAWLSYYRIWPQFLQQVFVGAANSKGSLWTIFFGFYKRLFDPITTNIMVAVLLLVAWLLYDKKILVRQNSRSDPGEMRRLAVFGLLAATAIFLPFAFRVSVSQAYSLMEIDSRFSKFAFFGFMALLGCLCWRRLSGGKLTAAPFDETVVLLAVTGIFWCYASGMSYAIEAQIAIPTLSLVIAFAYDRLSLPNAGAMRGMVTAIALLIVGVCMAQKYPIGFSWTGWREEISVAGPSSHWPRLNGFRAATIVLADSILDDVHQHAADGDTIFTFPHMPMFNYEPDHPQPTFCQVHYWDICPDSVAVADAERVRAVRPKVIVNMEFPEGVWKIHEGIFRNGRRSGQRDIQKVIDDLTSSPDYRLVRTYEPFLHYKIYVWSRQP